VDHVVGEQIALTAMTIGLKPLFFMNPISASMTFCPCVTVLPSDTLSPLMPRAGFGSSFCKSQLTVYVISPPCMAAGHRT